MKKNKPYRYVGFFLIVFVSIFFIIGAYLKFIYTPDIQTIDNYSKLGSWLSPWISITTSCLLGYLTWLIYKIDAATKMKEREKQIIVDLSTQESSLKDIELKIVKQQYENERRIDEILNFDQRDVFAKSKAEEKLAKIKVENLQTMLSVCQNCYKPVVEYRSYITAFTVNDSIVALNVNKSKKYTWLKNNAPDLEKVFQDIQTQNATLQDLLSLLKLTVGNIEQFVLETRDQLN
jgi:hypothetical protein